MTDVLVVGAGPTGLMLANQLGRRGVRVTIIDRHSGPARESRAMAVHARTLEIYSKLGLVERALELGTPGYGANMWAGGRFTFERPLRIGQTAQRVSAVADLTAKQGASGDLVFLVLRHVFSGPDGTAAAKAGPSTL